MLSATLIFLFAGVCAGMPGQAGGVHPKTETKKFDYVGSQIPKIHSSIVSAFSTV
jgi:hypothetical protein